MKKIKYLLFILLCSGSTYGKQGGETYDRIAARFCSYFNDENYNSIWHLFAKDMQAHLPPDKAISFFSGIKNDYGKIEKHGFDHNKPAIATYKLTFEGGVLALNFAIDNENKITSLTITPFVPSGLPELQRNTTKLKLPFEGEWTVFWGGDTKEQNHHVENRAQKNAFDILVFDEHGKSHRSDGNSNEDYYAFGKKIIAPCDAVVVLAVDGVKDNRPGETNPVYVPGNTVILKTSNNEFLFFAHFKQHSVKVKEGDRVRQGQLLGNCGNSGNSTEAHLHFHIQNVEDVNIATGAKCYFDNLQVNGISRVDYSPVKGDKVQMLRKEGR